MSLNTINKKNALHVITVLATVGALSLLPRILLYFVLLLVLFLYRRDELRKKRNILKQIHDLNNKLSPLFLLPGLVKFDRTDEDFVKLKNDATVQCDVVMPKIKEIIGNIHADVESL